MLNEFKEMNIVQVDYSENVFGYQLIIEGKVLNDDGKLSSIISATKTITTADQP